MDIDKVIVWVLAGLGALTLLGGLTLVVVDATRDPFSRDALARHSLAETINIANQRHFGLFYDVNNRTLTITKDSEGSASCDQTRDTYPIYSVQHSGCLSVNGLISNGGIRQVDIDTIDDPLPETVLVYTEVGWVIR